MCMGEVEGRGIKSRRSTVKEKKERAQDQGGREHDLQFWLNSSENQNRMGGIGIKKIELGK